MFLNSSSKNSSKNNSSKIIHLKMNIMQLDKGGKILKKEEEFSLFADMIIYPGNLR